MNFKELCFATVIIFIIMFLVVVLTSPAFADEVRIITVIDFDFETADVVFEDEDGYIWLCSFGQNEWAVGEQYYLFLPEDGEPKIFE